MMAGIIVTVIPTSGIVIINTSAYSESDTVLQT